MYDNIDGNTSFQYRISQIDTVNQINIRITSQDNEEISTLDNWHLTLQLITLNDINDSSLCVMSEISKVLCT